MQGHIAVLMVTETLSIGNDAILKAGINKIMQGGKKTIVLDLAQAILTDPPTIEGILTFEKQVKAQGGRLLIVSPDPRLGHVQNLKSAIDLLNSDLSALRATEASLNTRLEKLDIQKKELEQKVQGLKSSVLNTKKLRQEHSQLNQRFTALEVLVKRLLEKRLEATLMPSLVTKAESIHKALIIALEQEGLLPVR
jgi:anti-anti-sigma regulatory factor